MLPDLVMPVGHRVVNLSLTTPAHPFGWQMSALGVRHCVTYALLAPTKESAQHPGLRVKKHLWPGAAYLRADGSATGKTRSKNGQANA